MKSRTLLILASSAALALGLPGPLQAQSDGAQAGETRGGFHRGGPRMGPRGEGGPGPMLQQLDQDGDGLLSREELQSRSRQQGRGPGPEAMLECMRQANPDFAPQADLAERFDTLDSNDDSFLDAGELAALHSEREQRRMARLDKDADGAVSREERHEGREQARELRRALRTCRQEATESAAP